MRKLQKIAADALEDVLAGAALHQVLPAGQRLLTTPGERGALQDLVYGSLRQLGRIDAWLDALLERPLTDPHLESLLRIALYQMAYTRAPAHAIVHNAVSAAGGGWRRGLANAVLRNFQRRRAELDALAEAKPGARWSHPEWWIEKLRAAYPERWQAILAASLLHPPFTLRVSSRHGDVASYLAELNEAGLPAHRSGQQAVTLEKAVPVQLLPGFAEGRVSVQDAGAQHAARLLGAKPGERVLDACAAPGGKTGHILELADVDLVALDVDAARLARVQENLDRLRLHATLVEGDAARPEAWWDGRPFDRILADVPCSASGVVRRNPDIKWLRRPGDIAQFAAQQAVIVEALWRLLRPGGTLLYATCSIFHEENEGQVQAFLARHVQDAERCSLPEPLSDGSLLPDAEHDGFFYALLRKI
ncbi:Fmu, rRNA SAM-dependent methyltransferase [Thiobacillus denitrificans ATCC 25259]|uniref:16S rRNA (cytosine(967)-C(5))-methyltransferase n=1 Tax=Thiobacillus denitrificans (strain ATCC 25259 / T1) TaxID=292415 RepID=Q3SMS2_THIDA|nr:16S rRNA (cytosine(967)-C(5))-methyltransferase RsmB [Thiobacillus denitrificans]AAZ95969.1 Fmu, rRNA SAM-dependent methyltransferase [Thiobacillus denitrificans ATCC 25259]